MEKEFVFIGSDTRPYYIQGNWLWWWHPDKKWVSGRQLTALEIEFLPDNLSRRDQSLYFVNSEYKPAWYIETRGDFCACGQVKHVGFDQCCDCLDAITYNKKE